MPATDSGATTSARRPLPSSDCSTQATSCVGLARAGAARWCDSSSSAALACCLRTGSGSSGLIVADRRRAPARVAASSSVTPRRSGGGRPAVSRPAGASASPTASASPASASASATSGVEQRPGPAGGPVDRRPGSARPAPPSETRSASSCASSTISSLCGGTMCRPASMSTASRLWLVTTMSASRARARDASAKHSAPNGQRRRADALAGRHRHQPPGRVVDARVELVAVAGRRSSSAQSRSRWICLPSRPASPSHCVPPPGASSKSVSVRLLLGRAAPAWPGTGSGGGP